MEIQGEDNFVSLLYPFLFLFFCSLFVNVAPQLLKKIRQTIIMDEQAINDFKIYLMKLGQEYLPKVAGAILILIVGWWLIGRINRWFSGYLRKREVDESVVPFLSGIINFGLKILLILSVTSLVGVPITSFVAVLGAAGLAVGLALQGSLANFAGGVLILLFKPFKIGDLIESDGVVGTVHSITVLNTILTTAADNTAILPNGQVANNKVLNYTKEHNRRVDLTIGIAYDADVELAKKVIVRN